MEKTKLRALIRKTEDEETLLALWDYYDSLVRKELEIPTIKRNGDSWVYTNTDKSIPKVRLLEDGTAQLNTNEVPDLTPGFDTFY